MQGYMRATAVDEPIFFRLEVRLEVALGGVEISLRLRDGDVVEGRSVDAARFFDRCLQDGGHRVSPVSTPGDRAPRTHRTIRKGRCQVPVDKGPEVCIIQPMPQTTKSIDERIAELKEVERRRQKIITLRQAGKTMREIGLDVGLSKQRVDQILKGARA